MWTRIVWGLLSHQLLGLSLTASRVGNLGQEDMVLSTCYSNPVPEATGDGQSLFCLWENLTENAKFR